MSCATCGAEQEDPIIALVDYYMSVGTTGIKFVAATQAQLRSWGPVFSTLDTQAAYRRAGSTLVHMALIDSQTFGFLRLAAGYTLAEEAVILGVTVPEIQAWEAGTTPVPINTWYALGAQVCALDKRVFSPYPTLPPVDLRPRVIRVRPDFPRVSTQKPLNPCLCAR